MCTERWSGLASQPGRVWRAGVFAIGANCALSSCRAAARHTRRVRVFVCLIGVCVCVLLVVLLCPLLGWGGMCVVFGEYDACMAFAPAAVRARAVRA